MRLAGTFDPQPDEVVHPSFPNRNYMEVLGGAGSWVATPADVVKIVDSLDNTKPGFHPLPDDLAAADAQAGGRDRLPVDAGAVVRAGDDRATPTSRGGTPARSRTPTPWSSTVPTG